ncbi:complex I assembly factor ACAD9, mitochondrial [Diprion similis]|uniref:complex I assembly factor ACAD9, mitochondrial n=1 Tax=Diprion similis TaxID=362088 RepID=UPI001EF89D09|nr:complex I assembly factor ACAD9, mitochondrial [Diprion similis]
MLTTRMLLRRHTSYLKYSYASARRFTQPAEEAEDIITGYECKLAPLPLKKPQREPFAKNLFIGRFDNDLLAYPEVQPNERQNQFNAWLAPIEDCVKRYLEARESNINVISNDLVEQLKDFGVFRATIPEEYKGIGLNTTEYARLIEVVGKHPSLASYVMSRTEPVEIILKYGTDQQQQKFLPRIVSGELIPTLALAEDNTNIDAAPINATAVAMEGNQYFKLNAKKVHVLNGNNANCFIVLVNCTETDDPLHKPNTPTIFIVERENGGIDSSTKVEKIGQQGLEVFKVDFAETLVPRENVLGAIGGAPKIAVDLITLGKECIGSQAAAILKDFINILTKYAIEKKHYDKQIMTYDFAKEIIAKMSTALYAIESMTYMTTGLIDEYKDQNCSVESAIVAAYSMNECVHQILEGLKLLGRQTYLKDSPYERIYLDALGLVLYNESSIDLHTYIAIMGLHHSGLINSHTIQKYRNPFMFPAFMFREAFWSSGVPDLALDEHLHPSLQVSAKLLQAAVHWLHESTEKMLITHGTKVSDAHMELHRLANMAIDVYMMTAALGRASRSYCIGLALSDKEIVMVHSICWNAHRRVKKNNEEINLGDEGNCDDLYRIIAKKMFAQHGYFPEHPLKKNF